MPNPVTSDSFKKIILKDASDNVVNIVGADSSTDTLTLKVGLGMSISANESNDTVNIGIISTVNTAALNDILSNGNTSTFGITVADVTVDDVKINLNKIQVDHATNNLTLETTGTGTVVINDTLTVQNIIPSADVTYDLGSSSRRFRDLWLSGSSIKLGNATITSTGSAVNLPAGSQLGGVDLGTAVLPAQTGNIGKLLSTNGTTPYWTSITEYVLPTASAGTLGGVKVDGSTININGSGVISATYTLPTANTTTLGGVKVDGSTINIDGSGVISASLTASSVGLGNVTNESKATMFTNPTFTGTVSIPFNTGFALGANSNAGNLGISIGYQTVSQSQGQYAVSIGANAGQVQAANTIILNASGSVVNGVSSQTDSFYVSPIRSASSTNFLYYDPATKEITYNASVPASTFGDRIQLGTGAGQTGWSGDVAIGYQTQNTGSNNFSQAIGYQAGQTSQAASAVALGYQAGNSSQGQQSIAIGREAGKTGQLSNSIAIGGAAASQGSQGQFSVSIGDGSSLFGQGSFSVAIGRAAGTIPQSGSGVIIGAQSHNITSQGSNGVSIGFSTGNVVYGPSLTNVSITDTTGGFSCDAVILTPGMPLFLSGTAGGTGSITGYTSGKYYRVSTVTSPTVFRLVNIDGTVISTTPGTLTGLFYLVNLGLGDNVVSISATGTDATAVRHQNSSTFIRPVRQFDSPSSYSAITGPITVFAGGIFQATANTGVLVGNQVLISGANGGTGSISGYVPANNNIYYVIAVNKASTIFQLSTTIGGSAVTTTAGSWSTSTFSVIYDQPTGDTLPSLKYNATTGEVLYVNAEDDLNLRMKSSLTGVSIAQTRPSDTSVSSIFTRMVKGVPSVLSGYGGNELMLGVNLGTSAIKYNFVSSSNTSTQLNFGFGVPAVNTGLATLRNPATTNAATRITRLGIVSAASAGATAELIQNAQSWVTTGDGNGLGGFHCIWKFVISDASIPVTGARFFAGLSNNTAARTNAEPTGFLNSIGIAQLSTDATQFYIVYNGSGTGATIPLGTNFPCNPTVNSGSDIYEVHFYSASTRALNFYYYVKRVGPTGTVFQTQGNVSGTAVQMPANTVTLVSQIWRCTNASTNAVAFDLVSNYLESEN